MPRTHDDNARAWVELDLRALVENAEHLLQQRPGTRLLPVIKADAYGLGAIAVARALERVDPWGFAVATPEEAIELREAGVTRPLLVLCPAQPGMEDLYRRHDLRAVLDRLDIAADWPLAFHLEIDTGMSRTGLPWTELPLGAGAGLDRAEGVFTHLHSADEGPATVETQLERFRRIVATAEFAHRPLLHFANSAGVWRVDDAADLLRPGLFIYGGCSGPDIPRPRPVIALKARVIGVPTVPAGETVSYGGTWRAERPTRIATLGIGYADGVPRALQEHGAILCHGVRCPITGRVTMDMTMIAVESSVQVGDVATLIGRDGAGEITLDEFAAWSGTISWESLVRLGPRLPRIQLPVD